MNEKKNFVKEFGKNCLSIIKEPKTFFAKMPTSGGFKDPIIFLTTIIFLNLLVFLVFYIGILYVLLIFSPQEWGVFLFILLIWILSIASVFIVTSFAQFFIKYFGGVGSYEATFRILAYSSAVFVFSMIPLIGWIACLWGIALTIIGIEQVHGLSRKKSIVAVVTSFVLLFISVIPLILISSSMHGIFSR